MLLEGQTTLAGTICYGTDSSVEAVDISVKDDLLYALFFSSLRNELSNRLANLDRSFTRNDTVFYATCRRQGMSVQIVNHLGIDMPIGTKYAETWPGSRSTDL